MKPGWTLPAPPTPVLPGRIPHGPHPPTTAARVSPPLLEAAGAEGNAVFETRRTSKAGLSEEDAARRLRESAPNVVARGVRPRKLRRQAFRNPLVIRPVPLAASSLLAGDGGAWVRSRSPSR